MKGIYCYRDKKDNSIVYIGKDSHIDEDRRHKDHMGHSRYNEQQINRVIQNNPDRYDYEVLLKGDISEKLLNGFEMAFIRMYDPLFNFTIGGDGISGFKHSEEAKRKISEANKGKKLSEDHKQKISESHKGKTLSEETKRKLSEANKGKTLSEETKRKVSENNAKYWKGKTRPEETKRKMSEANKGKIGYWKGKTRPEETKRKMSEAHTKKYARIVKTGSTNGKQIYSIIKDGKRIKYSINPSKLLEWFTKEYPKEILQIKINIKG